MAMRCVVAIVVFSGAAASAYPLCAKGQTFKDLATLATCLATHQDAGSYLDQDRRIAAPGSIANTSVNPPLGPPEYQPYLFGFSVKEEIRGGKKHVELSPDAFGPDVLGLTEAMVGSARTADRNPGPACTGTDVRGCFAANLRLLTVGTAAALDVRPVNRISLSQFGLENDFDPEGKGPKSFGPFGWFTSWFEGANSDWFRYGLIAIGLLVVLWIRFRVSMAK